MHDTSRRKFIAAAVAAPVVGVMALNGSLKLNVARAQGIRRHICLVHGAWHGGWAWTQFAPLLEDAGYEVSHPDLSGLGANSHRQAPEIGLHVHGRDVLNHLYFNDIRDAVVVGHSYGGCVLSEALAGDDEGRISHAVYLDALIPKKGESLATFTPPNEKANFEKSAENGGMIPPRPQEVWEKIWGLTGESAAFAGPRLRPMSARCFTEAVQGDPFKRDLPRTFLRCVKNINPLFDRFYTQAKSDKRFNHREINGHHDVMVIDPKRLMEALLEIL